MNETPTSSKVRHVPRRSGVGMRSVLKPKTPKPKPLRFREVATLCDAPHPERTGSVALHGESIDPITCTRVLKVQHGQPVPHKGEHRARPLVGHVVRWADAEVSR